MFAPSPYASPTPRSRGHSSSSSTDSHSYMSTPSSMSFSSSSSLSLPVSPDGTDALTASMSSSSISSTSAACSACCHSERGFCPQHKLIQLSLKGIDSSGTRPRNFSQPLPMTGSSRTLAAAAAGGSKERRSSITNRDMEFISTTRTPRAPFIKPLNTNIQRATSLPATNASTSTSNATSNMHSKPNPSSTSMTMSPISASSLLSTRSLQRSLAANSNPSTTLASTYSPTTFLSPLPTLSQYATFQPPSSASSSSSSSGSSPVPAPRNNPWGLSLSLSPIPPPRFSTMTDSYALPTTASTAFPTFSPLMPNNHSSRDFNNKRVADCLEESAPSSPWIAHDQNAKKRHVYVSPAFNPRNMQAQMMTSNTAATGSAISSAYASLATSPYSSHVSPFGHTPLTCTSGYTSGGSSPSTTYATPIPISPFLPSYPLSTTHRHARRRSSNPFEFPPGSFTSGSGSGSGPNSANSSPSTSRRNSLLPPPPIYGSDSGSSHALEVNATLTMPSTMPIANMSYDTNMAEQPPLTFTPSPLPLNVLANTAAPTSASASSSASTSTSVTPSITPVPAAISAPPSSFSSSMSYYPPVPNSVSDPAPVTGSASTRATSVESAAAVAEAGISPDADEEATADADLSEELAQLHQQLSLQAEQARRQLQDVQFRMQVTAASIDTIHAMMMAKQRTPTTPATPITPNNTAATTPTNININMYGSGPTTPSHMTPMQLPIQMPPPIQPQIPPMGLTRSQSVPYPSHSHGYAHGQGQGVGHGYSHGTHAPPYTMSMTPVPYSFMDQHMTPTISTPTPYQ